MNGTNIHHQPNMLPQFISKVWMHGITPLCIWFLVLNILLGHNILSFLVIMQKYLGISKTVPGHPLQTKPCKRIEPMMESVLNQMMAIGPKYEEKKKPLFNWTRWSQRIPKVPVIEHEVRGMSWQCGTWNSAWPAACSHWWWSKTGYVCTSWMCGQHF